MSDTKDLERAVADARAEVQAATAEVEERREKVADMKLDRAFQWPLNPRAGRRVLR